MIPKVPSTHILLNLPLAFPKLHKQQKIVSVHQQRGGIQHYFPQLRTPLPEVEKIQET